MAPEESPVPNDDVAKDETPNWDADVPEPSCGVVIAPAVMAELAEDSEASAAGLREQRKDTVEIRMALSDFPAFVAPHRGMIFCDRVSSWEQGPVPGSASTGR